MMRTDDLLVTLETELGPMRMDIATEDRVGVEAGFFRQPYVTYQGAEIAIRASVRLYEDGWHVNRTEGGNESKASLDVMNKGVQVGKKTRDAVRAVLVTAVRDYFKAHPGKLVLAKRERLVSELRRCEADLKGAQARVQTLVRERARAFDQLEAMPQNLDSEGNPVSV